MKALSLAAWFAYGLTTVTLALGITWGLYAQMDYGYPFWYDALDIGPHIEEYAPLNRYHRRDFQYLDAATHQALFHDIRIAVHDGGRGLAALSYPDRQGRDIPLLRHAEVLHLQDVAQLIDLGRWALLVAALLWLPLAWMRVARPPPGWRARALVAVTPLLAMVGWLLVAGPTAVFYRFHIWLFPAEHEWFFYWQDSLMSTLMKAPVLFGGIAVVLVGGTLVLTPLLYRGGLALVRRVRR
ncbi:DUF1461 domain-containing protein [Alloalcanivorax sp. C16-2]|uniref:lipoprotein intramolecular transacylase Lit n=1 Tax=Alloalcanivorax TaxID=3020832 RepID=UPI001932A3FB|nr:DUF1461 domain-containing protein [Alloalcanivorax marinus]MBL7249876.1 DUF1461 domain-containing protein [Alloalcanivorax marinus]